jgi:branched-subunit amino acid ABC-type transport system permease component
MAVTVNVSALDVWQQLQVVLGQPTPAAVNAARWLTQPLSNYAPLVPYALLVAVIALRPQGLWGSERQP